MNNTLILALLGGAAGVGLTAAGLAPDGLADGVKDQIASLAADSASDLKNAGIQLLDTEAATKALENTHHIFEHGDKFIAVAKDGLTQLDPTDFASNLQDTAKAINAHFIDPSKLTDLIKDMTPVTNDNLQSVTDSLAGVFGKENAAIIAKEAMESGGKLTEATLSTIGNTPFEQAMTLSKIAPAGVGVLAGAGAGAMLPSEQKPVVGPQTQRIIAERQKALSQSLDTLQQNGFRTA